MKLYLSLEQEAVLSDCLAALKVYPDSPYRAVATVPAIAQGRLGYYYVTVANPHLYDGPMAKHPPGAILALIGPVEEQYADDAFNAQVRLLRSLGHEIEV